MSCEEEKVSHGPLGAVGDRELLTRVVNTSHLKITGHGRFKNNLFPPEDIRTRGISLIRADKLEAKELTAQGKSIAQREVLEADADAPKFEGFSTCRAEDIRAMTLESGSRALCLVDSPIPGSDTVRENSAHADAKHPVLLEQGHPDLLEVQKALLDLFVCLATAPEIKRGLSLRF